MESDRSLVSLSLFPLHDEFFLRPDLSNLRWCAWVSDQKSTHTNVGWWVGVGRDARDFEGVGSSPVVGAGFNRAGHFCLLVQNI
jgi:hypothetical protein